MLVSRIYHQVFSTCKPSQLSSSSLQQPFLSGLALTYNLPRRTMATAMAKRLEGKTIVVTGASSGIGKSTGFFGTIVVL